MNDLTREQCFCQWVISKILALYITQEDFRNEVDSKLNDGYSFSINGEKMDEYEQAELKLSMVCVDIAKKFTEFYFKELWGDEFEAEEDEPQTCEECEHWNDTEDGCADRHGCKITERSE